MIDRPTKEEMEIDGWQDRSILSGFKWWALKQNPSTLHASLWRGGGGGWRFWKLGDGLDGDKKGGERWGGWMGAGKEGRNGGLDGDIKEGRNGGLDGDKKGGEKWGVGWRKERRGEMGGLDGDLEEVLKMKGGGGRVR